jgi:hypothetical protein
VNDNNEVVGTLIGRVEIDPETYFPYSFQRREQRADGTTPTPQIEGLDPNRRIVYTTAELLPRETLPGDFFSAELVAEQVLSMVDNLREIEALGLEPLWLGEVYEGDGGILGLPEKDSIFVSPGATEAELHYALLVPASETEIEPLLDSVVIRLGTDVYQFGPPAIESFGGELPEQEELVEWEGGEGVMYTSLLTPTDTCRADDPDCIPTAAPLYRRLIFRRGETAVQIEAMARIAAGGIDLNWFKQPEGLVQLAQALEVADTSESEE